ncbi:hypothetical protein FQR65_LT10163 [Abscondita terminalis]|nr:hypothetical protein FQR65_LT10163 [Abscondita terminalis]
MDVVNGLLLITIIYCLLFFFDTFFKSCAHYPYIKLLHGTGFKIKLFHLQWNTTALNRILVRWGSSHLRFFNVWFTLGLYVTLLLLPISICLILYALFQIITARSDDLNQNLIIEPIIPGINLPLSELGFYSVTLIFCSIVHEVGHALAAVKEDVHLVNVGVVVLFIIPVAYVNINIEKLSNLNPWKTLRILCAGVWHNIVLAFLVFLMYIVMSYAFSTVFYVDNGIYITNVDPNSPLAGPRGLYAGDIITNINDCVVRDEISWTDCLVSAWNNKPGFCVTTDLVHSVDESIPIFELPNGAYDCCGPSKKDWLCFEYADNNDGVLELPPHMCLPARKEYAESAMNELLAWYGYGNAHENSKLFSSCHSQPGSNSSEPDSPKVLEECEWCGKHISDSKGLLPSGAAFCSELCFSQSRRANFKKNRTCDWCKHLRHTVSYVDFQDGASQLQFCSDKCLNQYKMHIFCRETRAHLELHPHIAEGSEIGGSLITPDLWLKNCKSPEHSGSSPNSPRVSENMDQTSPLPLINATQLLKSENTSANKRLKTKVQKKYRRSSSNMTRSSIRSPPVLDAPQDLRVRHTPNKYDSIHFKEYRLNDYGTKELPNRFVNLHNGTGDRQPKYVDSQSMHDFQNPFLSKPTSLESLMPPVTVLVPYPIIIPLPLPIPIPIPMTPSDLDALSSKTKNPTKNDSLSKDSIISSTATEDTHENVLPNIQVIKQERDVPEPPPETPKISENTPNKKKKWLISQKTDVRSVKKKKLRLT